MGQMFHRRRQCEGSAESSEGLEANKLTWLGTGLRLGQRRSKATWTARCLVRGNR